MNLTLNINDQVEVTLTSHGAKLYNTHLGFVAYDYPEQKKTCGDVLKTELWNLMSIFGDHLYNGMPQGPFASNEVRLVSRGY